MTSRPYIGSTVSKLITSTSTGVGADLVYKVPPRHEAEITFFVVSNASGAPKKISVQIKDNGSYLYLIKEKSIAANTMTPLIESSRIFLKEGDEIRAYKEAGEYEIYVSLSVKQYAKAVRRG
jgi:hypothetical protein